MPAREVHDGPDGPEHELPRGDVTEGVVRIGATVRRPHRPGSDAVATYLDRLEGVGFDRAPRYLGRDAQGRDVLDFLAGDVAGDRLPAWAATEGALVSLARLTRRLHDASAGWLPDATVVFPRDHERSTPLAHPPGEPVAVFHNDITPQNVVFRAGEAWGVVDFDLAGRATALTDLATTAMYWVPLQDPADRDPVFASLDVGARLRVFLDAYGLPVDRRAALLDAAALRFAGFEESMRWRAEHLGGGWARMWAAGVGDIITRRVAWFDAHRDLLLAAITGAGSGQDGDMTDHDDTDALQQQFVAARERLSVARATLDQYASTVGQPVDTVPEEPAYVVNPAYDTAREEYEAANAEFVRLETALKPRWAEQASETVE